MNYSERLLRRKRHFATTARQPELAAFRWKLACKLFARQHGLRVPELYWAGPGRQIPFPLLPPRVALKPDWGSYAHGVFLADRGRDVRTGRPIDPAEVLRAAGDQAYLAEALLTEPGVAGVPRDYKLWAFGTAGVAAVEVMDRNTNRNAWYTAAWEGRLPVNDLTAEGWTPAPPDEFPRPPCLDQMVEWATRLTAAAGTFLRVDFYSTINGAVFGETTVLPSRGLFVRPEGDEELGRMWADAFGDAL